MDDTVAYMMSRSHDEPGHVSFEHLYEQIQADGTVENLPNLKFLGDGKVEVTTQ